MNSLKQTSTVSAYKTKFDSLLARADIGPELHVHYWQKGLKPSLARQLAFDPLTKRKYTSLTDAQNAALAVGAFETTAEAQSSARLNAEAAPFQQASSNKRSKDNRGQPINTGNYGQAVQVPRNNSAAPSASGQQRSSSYRTPQPAGVVDINNRP